MLYLNCFSPFQIYYIAH